MVNGSTSAVVAEGVALAVNVANGPGNTTDWVGLAAAGTPDTAIIAWVYLNGTYTPPDAGVTSATVTMTAPTSDGAYEARFYLDNAWTVSARTGFAVVGVAPPPPPLPTPLSVSLTPAMASMPDNSLIGTQVCSVAVNMSDGSPFSGQISIYPGNMIGMSGSNSVLTRGLVSTDDGAHSFGITATQNGVSAQATLTVDVIPVAPPPPPPPPGSPAITVDGVASGATVIDTGSFNVAVSNGPGNPTDWIAISTAGSPDSNFGGWAYLDGSHTAPTVGLTTATLTMDAPTPDSAYEARFYADNGFTVLARAPFLVQPPARPVMPLITVTPIEPEIADTTPKGTVVATFSVINSDGSPFTGTTQFGAPFYDAGGIFALAGNSIIVNPTGPGSGPNMTTITDHITLEAIP